MLIAIVTGVAQAVCLWHAVPAATDTIHEWKFSLTSVKKLTRCQRNNRSMFLYVHENSDDFQVVFPTTEHRGHCYDIIVDMMRAMDTSVESCHSIDITPNIIHVRITCTSSFRQH